LLNKVRPVRGSLGTGRSLWSLYPFQEGWRSFERLCATEKKTLHANESSKPLNFFQLRARSVTVGQAAGDLWTKRSPRNIPSRANHRSLTRKKRSLKP
jgi:hypothetical protein